MERNRNDAEDKSALSLSFKTLLTEPEAAIFLGISYHTLMRLRKRCSLKPSLPYSCLGGVIRYNPMDLESWARTQRFPSNRGKKKQLD